MGLGQIWRVGPNVNEFRLMDLNQKFGELLGMRLSLI